MSPSSSPSNSPTDAPTFEPTIAPVRHPTGCKICISNAPLDTLAFLYFIIFFFFSFCLFIFVLSFVSGYSVFYFFFWFDLCSVRLFGLVWFWLYYHLFFIVFDKIYTQHISYTLQIHII